VREHRAEIERLEAETSAASRRLRGAALADTAGAPH